MRQKDLPQRWQDKLQNYLLEIGSKYNELSADAFKTDLKLEFADGSNAFFYFAFYWIANETKEIAVFTERCGYHIFPLIDKKIETFSIYEQKSIKFEDFTIE